MRKLFGKCRCTAGETLTAREESGQAVVEFALAFPLLLLILCGILDFGWIYMNQYRIEYAAFTGARYAGIHAPDSDDDEALDLAVETLLPCLDEMDLALIMTVDPGFGGQKFKAEQAEKIRALRRAGFTGDISVDGGVSMENARMLVGAGASMLVMGTAYFRAADPAAVARAVRELV